MQKKIMAITIALILVLSIAMPLLITVQAVQIPTYLLVHAEPNPVGVGQNLYISLFMSKPIPTTSGQVYRGLAVTIVKPDGTNETLGPYNADQTGGVGGIAYSPSVIGNYTVQGFFPGQTLVNSADTLAAAISNPVIVVVQDNPVAGYSAPPLPTEYWSRPIIATNYMWAHLAGSWWGAGRPSFTDTGGYDAEGNTNYYSTAPNTGHIMWVKPTAFGGLVGEPILADQESQYTSTSILYRHFEPIILNGVIFYTEYPSIPNARPGWRAVDLRTGETLWTKETTDLLSFASVLKFHTVQEYGTLPLLWATNPSGSLVYSLYDPFSGAFIANITDAAPLAGFLTRTNSFLMHFNTSSGFDSQGDALDSKRQPYDVELNTMFSTDFN